MGELLDHPIYRTLHNVKLGQVKIDKINFYSKKDMNKLFWGACEILINGKWHASRREQILKLFKKRKYEKN